MIGYIYNLWDNIETNIFYVGSSMYPDIRIKQHNQAITKIDPATNEVIIIKPTTNYGIDILEEVSFQYKRELLSREIYWIHQIRSWGFNLKNHAFYKNFAFDSRHKAKMNRKYTSIHFGELETFLENEAKRLDRSMSWLVCSILKDHKFLSEFMKNHPELKPPPMEYW